MSCSCLRSSRSTSSIMITSRESHRRSVSPIVSRSPSGVSILPLSRSKPIALLHSLTSLPAASVHGLTPASCLAYRVSFPAIGSNSATPLHARAIASRMLWTKSPASDHSQGLNSMTLTPRFSSKDLVTLRHEVLPHPHGPISPTVRPSDASILSQMSASVRQVVSRSSSSWSALEIGSSPLMSSHRPISVLFISLAAFMSFSPYGFRSASRKKPKTNRRG